MLFALLYFLIRRILGPGRRPQDERDIELLVLRHQVMVLQRQVKRSRLRRLDRVVLAAASRALPRPAWASFVMRPETLLRWHRELMRRKWTYKRRGRPGRPPVDPEVRDLIVRLGRENPRWGYQRIRGELLKLDIRISATTIRTILLRHGLDPAPRRAGPTWTEFLQSQAAGILACDFFTVEWNGKDPVPWRRSPRGFGEIVRQIIRVGKDVSARVGGVNPSRAGCWYERDRTLGPRDPQDVHLRGRRTKP